MRPVGQQETSDLEYVANGRKREAITELRGEPGRSRLTCAMACGYSFYSMISQDGYCLIQLVSRAEAQVGAPDKCMDPVFASLCRSMPHNIYSACMGTSQDDYQASGCLYNQGQVILKFIRGAPDFC
jgi:hypothetical protein